MLNIFAKTFTTATRLNGQSGDRRHNEEMRKRNQDELLRWAPEVWKEEIARHRGE
jgi:hypothetical protein